MTKSPKKAASGGVWECTCGHIDYGEFPPEDCPKCFRVGKFNEVPEDMVEDRVAENIITSSAYGEDDEEEDIYED